MNLEDLRALLAWLETQQCPDTPNGLLASEHHLAAIRHLQDMVGVLEGEEREKHNRRQPCVS
jgi:hypothetical protein